MGLQGPRRVETSESLENTLAKGNQNRLSELPEAIAQAEAAFEQNMAAAAARAMADEVAGKALHPTLRNLQTVCGRRLPRTTEHPAPRSLRRSAT